MPRTKLDIFMGTTAAPVHQSMGEITRVLAKAGATSISQVFARDGSGHVTGMNFHIPVGKIIYPYNLPVRTEALYDKIHAMRKRNPESHEDADRKQAERIAWRQLLRWVEAQMALVETGMVETREVFLPYCLDRNGKTIFQVFLENEKKMLGGGTGAEN